MIAKLGRLLLNIKEALKEPNSETRDTYIKLQVALAEAERERYENKYRAANIVVTKNEGYKGVF